MPRLFIIMAILSCIFMLHAEDRSYIKQYLLSYPITIQKEITAPIRWKTTDWLTAGSAVALGTGLYLYDEDINTWVHDHRSNFTHNAAQVGNFFGDGKYMFPGVSVVWMSGYLVRSAKTQDTGALMFKTMLIGGGTVSVLKYSSQRNRPQADKGKQFWFKSGFSLQHDSFPSGHAIIAFSMATIVAEQYKNTWWAPPLAYSGATLTCFARVHDQKHWSSDVFTGTVLGFFIAELVIRTTPKLAIAPSDDLSGVSLEYKF